MTRIFLIDALLPTTFWLDAVYAAVYTINRLPIPTLKDKSPYEVLFSKLPNYGFLKPKFCAYFRK